MAVGAAAVVLFAGAGIIGWYARDAPDSPTVLASASGTPVSGLATVPVSALPAQARAILALVDRGGPFRYPQDDTVFDNNERRLPARAQGYYHEYTVPTPGEPDRGPRRLVVGRAGDVYYTADHYTTFRQVLR